MQILRVLWCTAMAVLLTYWVEASVDVTDLVDTTGSPPDGWTYSGLGTAYADFSLQFDHTGDYVITKLYGGAVTSLVVETKGYSVSGGTRLDIIPSVDGVVWSEADKQDLTPSGSKTSQCFEFSGAKNFRAFKLLMQKTTGNIGLYSVTAMFVEGEWQPVVPPPVATAATAIASDSFSANWEAVEGAEGYLLDLYQVVVTGAVAATTLFEESFDGFTKGQPNDSANTTDVSSKLNDYTAVAGWSGDKVYEAGGSVKLGTTSVQGWLSTPPLDLSGEGGNFSVNFKACAWSKDATTFGVALLAGGVTNWQTVVEGLNNDVTYTFGEYSISGSGGEADAQLLFIAAKASYARFFLDDLTVTQGGYVGVPVTNIIMEAVQVSGCATNITQLVPGVYHYCVRAVSNAVESVKSNVITVDTMREPTPPELEPIAAQSVRVGEVLSLPVQFVPTDGDAITATTVEADGAVVGHYALVDGIFSYTPRVEDLGEQHFIFKAQDKDGWSAPVEVVVTVRRARVMAIALSDPEGVYEEDFDGLAGSGSDNEWDNWAWPLPGWSAFANNAEVVAYRTGSGTGTTGGIYSFGSGDNRGLGSLAASKTAYTYGVAFSNATGAAITELSISFKACQWRVANAQTQSLDFAYSVGSSARALPEGEWHRVKTLCFASPQVLEGEEKAGAVEVVLELSGVLPRPLAADQVVMLRWRDIDDDGSDHALGIDDLRVAWVTGAMPDGIKVGLKGVEESFDEVTGEVGAELPWMWRVVSDASERCSGSFAEGSECVQLAVSKQDFTACGSYSFVGAEANECAVGGLPGADAGTITIFGKFRNSTGMAVRRWEVEYEVEKYRNGTAATAVQLLVSRDGESWQVSGEPVVFAADADLKGYPVTERPATTLACERLVKFEQPVPNGELFYVAWQISVPEGASVAGAQALGIDEVSIRPHVVFGTIMRLE